MTRETFHFFKPMCLAESVKLCNQANLLGTWENCKVDVALSWHVESVTSKVEQCAELAFCLLRFAAPENYYKQLGIIIGNNSSMNIITY